MILRDYQIDAFNKARYKISVEKKKRLIIHSGTGTGKTVIGAEITRSAVGLGTRVLWLAHRKELINQGYRKLLENGIECNVVMADDSRRRPWLPVSIASVATLVNRKIKPVAGLILIDECHRAPAASYLKIMESYPEAVVLGLTATPCRSANSSGLGDMFEDMISCPSVANMMQRINPETGTPYLVPVVVYEPKRPDISKVGTGANGDYATAGLSKIYGNPVIVGSIVDHWLKYGERRRTILFAAGIEDSKGFVARLKENGVRAEHLDGTTPPELRDAILRRLESHETEVVSNVGVLTEGFDSPPTSCIILARPTKSVGLFLQMCGRALRPYPGKEDCIILDHAGCHQDHGDVDEEREWDLKAGVKRKPIPEDADMSAGMITCRECARRYRTGPRRCPSCGYERDIISRTVDEVDGELVRRVKEEPEKPKSIKQLAHEEKLKARYLELVKIALNTKKRDGTPYKPGYAAIQFHAETNWWPRKEWKDEATSGSQEEF